ncbi:UDP-glucose 4-epimerase GalE [Pseudoalteromonas piratica]|uniref:UDP-glucose 4-epimerase n=1 Tax=Pseudoalteromonas piratica TaxID=1348114 RepID=A0A0A7EDA8_9GAMM|nr:UDP-glucose 4-epimerase GalE [Pseudoalteromonas piratica]AIY64615.1 UDP-glucose 4-epimerase [Pseudoalteromonas piratica]
MTVLVTGGAGYIGSHTVVELLQAGEQVVVLDNLSNSSLEALKRVESITNSSIIFYQGDIRDNAQLDAIFVEHKIDSVVHFAGLKSVNESISLPYKYYDNNVQGTLNLLAAMERASVYKLVFSSSANVYGTPDTLPVIESAPVGETSNPYGTSKYMVERILQDLATSNEKWRFAILRYFNPVGAHKSGLIGEDPNDIPNNLLPYISQVAIGKLACLGVFGDDYDTPDGTGVRDYIHVVDLALGHLKALEKLSSINGAEVFNLGTGNGYSVLEMIKAFEVASGKSVKFEIKGRRSGDIAMSYANPEKAKSELNWEAKRGLDDMMADAWRWQSQNPNGYANR